ncbi:MAG: hypothetical protein GX337_05890 [Christensenellaceae bacterium]|nr:hypothetical protein [Christensenellaceae bacterium]
MYNENILNSINKQLKKRIALCALLYIAILGLLIYSTITRKEWFSYIFAILLLFSIIFTLGMFVSPIYSYKKFLLNMLYGKNRTMHGVFKGFIDSPAKREGVIFIPYYINIGDVDEEEDDRLLYYDANLELPDWKEGDKLSVTSHDRSTLKWEYIS